MTTSGVNWHSQGRLGAGEGSDGWAEVQPREAVSMFVLWVWVRKKVIAGSGTSATISLFRKLRRDATRHLTVCIPPNILVIALKRFENVKFCQVSKKVTFEETLDLGPFMSEPFVGNDMYKLYVVVVHVNTKKPDTTLSGHYICYVLDLSGQWYRMDDHQVNAVECREVRSQEAYMLLYSRLSANHYA